MAAMTQTKIPMGNDYCTVAWAAELAGVSMRTVTRAIGAGALHGATPRTGRRESRRHKQMLLTEEVRAWNEARKLLALTRGDE